MCNFTFRLCAMWCAIAHTHHLRYDDKSIFDFIYVVRVRPNVFNNNPSTIRVCMYETVATLKWLIIIITNGDGRDVWPHKLYTNHLQTSYACVSACGGFLSNLRNSMFHARHHTHTHTHLTHYKIAHYIAKAYGAGATGSGDDT